jgi:chromosome segregation ATPase
MNTSPTRADKSIVKLGLKTALALLLSVASVGCQSQRQTQEHQTPMQETMNNNTEKLLAQIKQLQEDQQQVNEGLKSIKVDQLTIGTKVAGAQRQLASQVLETTQAIQQEQAELKTTVQDTCTQFAQQLQVLAGSQQDLENVTATIHANGQTLCTSHSQILQQLTEFNQGYQHWQQELTLMQEKMAALDASIVAMQAGLGQFQSSLTKDIKGLAEDLATKRAVGQDMEDQLTTLTQKLTDAAELPKRPATLFPDIDKNIKTQKKAYSSVFTIEGAEKDQVSVSGQDDVETTPGVDSP